MSKPMKCKYPKCDYPCMNLPDCQEQKPVKWSDYEPDGVHHNKQEQGEPVGEILLTNGDYKEVSWKNGKLPPVGAKLYTTPQQRKPLTDEQRNWIVATCPTPRHIIDAVERMHGIKE